jgi:histidinol-phosphate aminotransferase
MQFSRRSFCQLFSMATGLKFANLVRPTTGFVGAPLAATDGFLHLDRNENAYGPAPKVITAIMSSTGKASRYSRSEAESLTDSIARFHGVHRDRVLLGAGSTDVLRMASQAFLSPKRSLIVADPTYGAPEYYARFSGAPVIKVPLTREFAHDLAAMHVRVSSGTGLAYICNPNNPTGTLTPREQIAKFIAALPANCVVVVDEAYHEYAADAARAYGTFIDPTLRHDRLIVLRTFSKAHGMAGLRLGYAVGAPELLEQMRIFALEDCVNSISAQAGLAALESQDAIRDSVERNEDARQEFLNEATGRMLKPIDSHANFAFMDVLRPAEVAIQHFHQHGIHLGPKFPSMPNHVRISFGTPEEMTEFWRVWDLLPIVDSM